MKPAKMEFKVTEKYIEGSPTISRLRGALYLAPSLWDCVIEDDRYVIGVIFLRRALKYSLAPLLVCLFGAAVVIVGADSVSTIGWFALLGGIWGWICVVAIWLVHRVRGDYLRINTSIGNV